MNPPWTPDYMNESYCEKFLEEARKVYKVRLVIVNVML